MSILDAFLLFDDGNEHTTTSVGTKVIDFGSARNMGVGNPIAVFIQNDVALADSGSNSTMTITLEGGSTVSGETIQSPVTVQTLGTFAASSPAGTKFEAYLNSSVNYKYLGIKYTVANGDLTSGSATFTAGLKGQIEQFKAYPSGYTVA